MLGAIIGDIAGSRYEWANIRQKQFKFFKYQCRPTDDTIMTLAVAKALTEARDISELSECAVRNMQEMGRKYPHAGYGGRFFDWIFSDDPQPFNSWANGAGMRVSPCAWAAGSLEEALAYADAVTTVTHNHPEGIKGARAVTAATYLAITGKSMEEIRNYIESNYYKIDFTLDEIRPKYRFDVSCQGSVPQALEAFFESTGYEDAVRNAISIGGDSDTIAAMAGAPAEAFWGIPKEITVGAYAFLDEEQKKIIENFSAKFPKTK